MKNGISTLMMATVLVSLPVAAQEQLSTFYAGAGYGSLAVLKSDDEVDLPRTNSAAIQFGYNFSETFSIEAQYSKSIKNATGKGLIEDVDITDAWQQAILHFNPDVSSTDVQQRYPYASADIALDAENKSETIALYGVYRSKGDLYLKAKAGYASTKSKTYATTTSVDVFVPNSSGEPIAFTATPNQGNFDYLRIKRKLTISETVSSFSAGLGVGYKFNSSLFSELEYTKLNGDFDFCSLSLNYAF